jgi:hypothetical protein
MTHQINIVSTLKKAGNNGMNPEQFGVLWLCIQLNAWS